MPNPAGHPATTEPLAASSDTHPVDNAVLIACALAWLSGLIHIQAAVDHIDEYLSYGVAFIALASAQFTWGIAVYRRPRRNLLIVGAIGSIAVVMAWACTRTIGLPVGPDVAGPEPPGLLDLVATADELTTAGLIALQLWAPPRARPALGARVITSGAVLLIVLSSLTLAGGVHAH